MSTPIDPEQFWEVYDAELPLLAARYGSNRARMAVIGLGGSELLVVSPGAIADEQHWAQLAKYGKPALLLAPNHFHNSGLAVWAARFPQAKVVAAAGALPRLRKKLPALNIGDVAEVAEQLPSTIRLMQPPTAKQGELWLSIATSGGQAWFVTDGLINERRLPPGPLGVLIWLVGFRAGLMTNPLFKRLFLADKQRYKAWVLEQLEADPPQLFLPSHGQPLRGPDVASRLRQATESA